jgi:uncharacterized protein (TIGR02001 family)
MRGYLLGVFCATAMCLVAAPASAQEGGRIGGNVALTSDYVFRGISQSDKNPAIQGGFDYTNGAFYAGAWASSVDFGANASGTGSAADLEVDVYGGWRRDVGPLALDFGVIGYLYPGSTNDFGEYDYWEGYAKASMAPTERTSVGVAAYYSPEFTTEAGDAWYVEANGSTNLSEAIAISGAVGYQTADAAIFGGEDSYTTWNVGGTLSAHGFGFDLRYHVTDIDDLPIADDRVVFTIRRSL